MINYLIGDPFLEMVPQNFPIFVPYHGAFFKVFFEIQAADNQS